MTFDEYGQAVISADDLCELLYNDPGLDLTHFRVHSADAELYNNSVEYLHADMNLLVPYCKLQISIEEFDKQQQLNWHMPDEYKNLDIVKWILDQCKEDYELQRVGQELLLYQEFDLFNLLRYLKYLVDTMRQNNVVWGVGRGSSVSSYILYIIGVHKINSIYYDLDIREFLKTDTKYGEN